MDTTPKNMKNVKYSKNSIVDLGTVHSNVLWNTREIQLGLAAPSVYFYCGLSLWSSSGVYMLMRKFRYSGSLRSLRFFGSLRSSPFKGFSSFGAWFIVGGILWYSSLKLRRPNVFSEKDISFAESTFIRMEDREVHVLEWKRSESSESSESSDTVILMAHGLGASSLQFSLCAPFLGDALNASVQAYDHPGFGLTQRLPNSQNSQNSLATSARIMASLVRRACDDNCVKRIVLLGHSMGTIVTAQAFLLLPQELRNKCSIVIVSTPITTPTSFCSQLSAKRRWLLNFMYPQLPLRVHLKENEQNKQSKQIKIKGFLGFYVFREILPMLVYTRLFWRYSLGCLYKDPSKITREIQNMYMWPSLCAGWPENIANFGVDHLWLGTQKETLRTGTLASQFVTALNATFKATSKDTSKDTSKTHFLIIHGDSDPLVPVAFSRGFASLVPRASFHVIPNVGHMPHEEAPVDFAKLVSRILKKLDTHA